MQTEQPLQAAASDRKRLFHDTRFRVGVLLSLWFCTFLPVYPSMVGTWLQHSDNSHGVLVPFVAIYFAWRERYRIASTPISNSNVGLLLLVVSLGLYLLSYVGGIAVIARSMIVFSLAGLLLCCLGKDIFKLLAFPLFFLLFMVPIPDSILGLVSFPLQLSVTKISTSLIQTVGIPAYREGNMVYFSNTQLEVAEACSGIRSLASLAMLSILFSWSLKRNWSVKLLLIASALPLAVFTNIVRVTGTGILAHFYGAKVALGFLHEFAGMVTFAFGFVLLSLLYWALNKTLKEDHVNQDL